MRRYTIIGAARYSRRQPIARLGTAAMESFFRWAEDSEFIRNREVTTFKSPTTGYGLQAARDLPKDALLLKIDPGLWMKYSRDAALERRENLLIHAIYYLITDRSSEGRR